MSPPTEKLGWVAVWCELWCLRTGPNRPGRSTIARIGNFTQWNDSVSMSESSNPVWFSDEPDQAPFGQSQGTYKRQQTLTAGFITPLGLSHRWVYHTAGFITPLGLSHRWVYHIAGFITEKSTKVPSPGRPGYRTVVATSAGQSQPIGSFAHCQLLLSPEQKNVLHNDAM